MPQGFQAAGVPESSSPILVVLLSSIVGLLVLIAGLLAGILRRLPGNVPDSSGNLPNPVAQAGESAKGDAPSDSAFELFLNEDPERRQLPKKDQFAAYRRWRKARGLNWSAGAGS